MNGSFVIQDGEGAVDAAIKVPFVLEEGMHSHTDVFDVTMSLENISLSRRPKKKKPRYDIEQILSYTRTQASP